MHPGRCDEVGVRVDGVLPAVCTSEGLGDRLLVLHNLRLHVPDLVVLVGVVGLDRREPNLDDVQPLLIVRVSLHELVDMDAVAGASWMNNALCAWRPRFSSCSCSS